MEEGTLKTMVVGFVLFSLIGFLLVTVVVNTSNEYNKSSIEVFGNSTSIQTFENAITDTEKTGRTEYENLTSSGQGFQFGEVSLTGIFRYAKNIGGMISAPLRIIRNLLIESMQIPRIVVDTLIGLIMISLGLAIWKLYRVGY